MAVPKAGATYDEVPYEGGVIAGTHPEHLATIARLFGIAAAPAESCTVLEIGCAAAANLVPMAYMLPGSHFVGIDPSHRQIEMGEAFARDYGVSNVELHATGVTEILDWDRKFDYIICHGVFSWVSPDIREDILDACRKLLAPAGIAYISYNTLPGFHARAAIAEMMRFHGAAFADPAERAEQGRALLQFLVEATGQFPSNSSGYLGAYHLALSEEWGFMQESRDSYLLHEHFSEYNDAFYLYEFVDMAAEHGLNYLGDAAFHSMLVSDLPAETAQRLNEIAASQVALEQYRDFVLNRMFRKSLVTRSELPVERHISVDAISSLCFRHQRRRPDPGTPWQIDKQGGLSVQVTDPGIIAVLEVLADAAPLALTFEELRLRVAATGVDLDGERLAAVLLSLYSLDAVEMRTWTPPMNPDVSERPAAFVPARRAARPGTRTVPMPLHGVVTLDPFVIAALPYVDGSRTVPELVADISRAIESGEFTIPHIDPEDLPAEGEVERLVTESLDELRQVGLLQG